MTSGKLKVRSLHPPSPPTTHHHHPIAAVMSGSTGHVGEAERAWQAANNAQAGGQRYWEEYCRAWDRDMKSMANFEGRAEAMKPCKRYVPLCSISKTKTGCAVMMDYKLGISLKILEETTL